MEEEYCSLLRFDLISGSRQLYIKIQYVKKIMHQNFKLPGIMF